MTPSVGIATAMPRVEVEHGPAFAVATARPRLSWRIPDAPDGWAQAGYEVAVDDGSGWREVKRDSSASVLVPWPFEDLISRDRVDVRVRAMGEDGSTTAWSDTTSVEVGLLAPADWVARAVTPDWPEVLDGTQPPALIRREFVVNDGLVRARLYVTAHGVYAASIDGVRVSDARFSPGWSAYRTRLRYQTYDVTDLLKHGPNAVGVVLADGWYRGFLVPTEEPRRNWYGTRVAALAQLELTYADGRRQVVATDPTWRAGEGPLRSADLYNGEVYDARLESAVAGWDSPGFDDSTWSGCTLVERDPATLVGQWSPPVRRTQTLPAATLSRSPSGRTIVDFGQNLVGHLRLRGIPAEPGAEVTLRHAEVLQDGELCTQPLRHARATDTYIVGDREGASWAPDFTFHGFRYAEITGWPELRSENVMADVLHTDMTRSGWFSCSDPLVNQLHENAVWSMRGNFLDVPTDCPQRDERLGWTGDLQIFTPSACFLYDSHGLLVSWLADLAADQDPSGGVPFVVPNPLGYLYTGGSAAAWSDAAVIVPWQLYQRYGDRDVLARQYPSVLAFADNLVREHGPQLNEEVYQFGDWVDPRAPADRPGDGPTEKLLVAGAHVVHALRIVASTAQVLEKPDDAARFTELADDYLGVWRSRFIQPDGRLTSDTATAYSLAVCFRLLDSHSAQAAAGQRLAELCEESGYRISTGFVGTPLVCDALTATGHLDTAYRLLLETSPPSFLYPVTQGATTVWERWDSLLPDGRVNPSGMTSFNHYALGAVVDWLHRCVGGVAPLAPGYREALVRPRPGGGLEWADTRHTTPYGDLTVTWKIEGATFTCEVQVPAGVRAVVDLPVVGWEQQRVGTGRHSFRGEFAPPTVPPQEPLAGTPWDLR